MVREHILYVFSVLKLCFFFFFLWTGIGLMLLNVPRALEKNVQSYAVKGDMLYMYNILIWLLALLRSFMCLLIF